MKALTSKDAWWFMFGRFALLCACVLLLSACKEPAQEASEKLLEATHADDVRDLLTQGADVNYMNDQGRTPLRNAVKYNEKSVVTLLLQSGANPNAQGADGNTALHDAAVEGHVELVEILLGNGADINAANKLGNTALHEAAAFDKHMVVQCLLGCNADAELKNTQGKTAYDCAVANKAEYAEKYLVSIPMTRALGSVLRICGDKELIYNLERFREGKLKVTEYPFLAHLCRFRGQGNRQDDFLCAEDSVIRFFISQGADVNAPKETDGVSRPPLLAAIESGKWEVVDTLLEHHATCKAERLDIFLRGLLCKGSDVSRTEALLKARKKMGSNPDRYTDGDSMLLDVITNNATATATDMVGLLLKNGADPNAPDNGIVSNAGGVPLPLSPIYAAAHRDNAPMVALLVKHGADINSLHGGMSDLGRAALCNDALVCRILLENGADTKAEDVYGETPLFWAIYNNNAEIVELLLKGGADPKVKSTIYKKALYKLAKSQEIKSLLHGKRNSGE